MSSDEIDDLVDWQMSSTPEDSAWSCPDCGMNWMERPDICPCNQPPAPVTELGQPNAAILELAFWEAIKRCALDEGSPITLSLRGEDEEAGISFGNRIPEEVWQHMAAAVHELRDAAGLAAAAVSGEAEKP